MKIIHKDYTAYYNDVGAPHREDGPAIEWYNGVKGWYLQGKRHRENGPAIEYTGGYKVWYLQDKRHREDGPAVEYSSGNKYWYLHGKLINCTTQKQFLKLMQLKAFW